ncbi:hypothetical protein ACFFMO_18535 [Lederbergia wuyishanensis]|uniref:Large-conductance mechanosensitive channel n=1 Tax=Lederbergia wuyishanensis TaxID=1347903 RepID=A0ABU0D971_9BACI|nr:hypothetical protein [Lederbergia wuyishanensis]MDQ0344925.1 large-conductance mechanosensitive channel [Lederbergia wuyishanensis]
MFTILNSFVLYMPFLYFPEDKTEYIPAAISMSVFIFAAILTFVLIKKVSKKQESKTKHLEDQIKQENKEKHL